MTQNSFQVVFSGVVVPGADREQVKKNLAQLFKAPAERIEPMFSGRRVVVKKGLPQEMALKYQAALRKAGAVCEVVDAAAAAQAPAPAPTPAPAVFEASEPAAAQAAATPAPAAPAQSSGPAVFEASEPAAAQPAANPAAAAPAQSSGPAVFGASEPAASPQAAESAAQAEAAADEGPGLAAPGEPIPSLEISRATVKEAPQGFGELEGAVIDQPDQIVVPDDTPPPAIDTSALTVAEAGTTLGEAEAVEELQVDLSGLSMGEPGETLAEPEEVKPLEVDTSQITLA